MVEKFTEEQIEEFREIFSMYDEDGGGSISTEELGKVMRNLGQNPTEEELKDIIAEIDIDGNGEVDFDEFLLLMGKNARETDIMDDYYETFQLFDRDNDNLISAADLKAVMATKDPLLDEEAEEMIREADRDEDGRINYDEFVDMMTRCSNFKDDKKPIENKK